MSWPQEMATAAVSLGADEGWTITTTAAFVVDEWPGMLTIQLPVHMAKDMTDAEIESALFSEYVWVNGDDAFAEQAKAATLETP